MSSWTHDEFSLSRIETHPYLRKRRPHCACHAQDSFHFWSMTLDKIDDIVDKAIEYTRLVLLTAPEHGETARAGLETMRDNLILGAPDHPALARLSAFLTSLGASSGKPSLH